MENKKLSQKLIEYINSNKKKVITLSEMYETLQLPYTPNSDKILFKLLTHLINENILQPIKTSSKDMAGNYKKYRIIHKQNEEEKNIQNEILSKLVKNLDINYYLKHTEEYIKEKWIIEPINEFLKNPSTKILTVNERSYELFQNEKLLKESEEILKKLKINYSDLYAYETYEPFFYYQNYESEGKTVLIVENKDTFWTIKNVVQSLGKKSDIAIVIYGEGKKILKSFEYSKDLGISHNDEIKYFGDIDYEGINIYVTLKEAYCNYNITAYKEGYKSLLDIENNPRKLAKNQNINSGKIQKFIEEFEDTYKIKLKNIFENGRYIPQEVFNGKIAETVIKE